MKNLMIALALGATLAATPALANNDNFTGIRIGGTAGFDDVQNVRDTTDVIYGLDAGVDLPLGENVVIGAEAFSTNFFEDERVIGAAARLGYASDNVMPFIRAGYSNYKDINSRELEGLTVGGGVEYALSENSYIKAEYRYTDFDQSQVGSHGGLVGVGLRF